MGVSLPPRGRAPSWGSLRLVVGLLVGLASPPACSCRHSPRQKFIPGVSLHLPPPRGRVRLKMTLSPTAGRSPPTAAACATGSRQTSLWRVVPQCQAGQPPLVPWQRLQRAACGPGSLLRGFLPASPSLQSRSRLWGPPDSPWTGCRLLAPSPRGIALGPRPRPRRPQGVAMSLADSGPLDRESPAGGWAVCRE